VVTVLVAGHRENDSGVRVAGGKSPIRWPAVRPDISSVTAFPPSSRWRITPRGQRVTGSLPGQSRSVLGSWQRYPQAPPSSLHPTKARPSAARFMVISQSPHCQTSLSAGPPGTVHGGCAGGHHGPAASRHAMDDGHGVVLSAHFPRCDVHNRACT
jgi:hypothetical protein